MIPALNADALLVDAHDFLHAVEGYTGLHQKQRPAAVETEEAAAAGVVVYMEFHNGSKEALGLAAGALPPSATG